MPVRARSQVRRHFDSGARSVLAVTRRLVSRPGARRPTVAALTLAATLAVAGCGSATGDDASQIVRTTTNIAGAAVMGANRDTRAACAAPSTPDPAAAATVTVAHADGHDASTQAPADPQRIVVLDTPSLDAACALGLQDRVVGAATLDGPRTQPRYLGPTVRKIPSVGSLGAPNPDLVRALHPDLIVAAGPVGTANWATLSAIAPTVFTASDHRWQQQFASAAAAMNRGTAAGVALSEYRKRARDLGAAHTVVQTQASVVRFTGDTISVQGDNSFAGQVLADVGVPRPQTQRGPSHPLSPAQVQKAEGDLIYVILAGEDGKAYGEKVMRGDIWRDLGAAWDRRVFAADDAIWNGGAPTAAHALLNDLGATLNGYASP